MLDINLFRNDLAGVAAGLAKRGVALDTARLRSARGAAQGHPDPHAGTAGAAQRAVEGRSARPRARARTPSALLAEVGGIGDDLDAPRGRARARPGRACATSCSSCRTSPTRSTPGRQGGRRQRRGLALGHAAGVRLPGQGPHRRRRSARAARLRDRRQAVRRALLVPARRPRAAAPRAGAVHARHPHARARLHRVLHALHRQRRDAGRHDAAAEVRGRHVLGAGRAASKAPARRSTSSRPPRSR